jgi:CheY-like chemotaxis protein
MTNQGTKPVILIAAPAGRSLASVLVGAPYDLYEVTSGAYAVEHAPTVRPDVIILDAELPDMSGMDVCRWLRSSPPIGRHVPILIATEDVPTPELRVAALRDGAWDFIRRSDGSEELRVKLDAYVQAKRNIDEALAEQPQEPEPALLNRPGLARRARELGALMSRVKGALACVVLAVDAEPSDPHTGGIVAGAARISDSIGALTPGEFAVLAPATDEAGALKLAERLSAALRERMNSDVRLHARSVRAGYVVANFGYKPMDPVAMMARAAVAVRGGRPEPGSPWVRRFEDSASSDAFAGSTSGVAHAGRRPAKGDTP